jgi:hypothetical protein
MPQTTDHLKPCPFCGWQPPADLSDVLYPSGTYRRWDERNQFHHYVSHNQSRQGDTPCWEMNCTANMGGCGASISADSEEEAVAAWNRRAVPLVAEAPRELHPNTSALVDRFAAALKEKLAAAEKKYGYSDGWSWPDWMDECRAKLAEHTAKGDPRDVAAYCAFLWHHGESTAAPVSLAPMPEESEADQRQFIGDTMILSALISSECSNDQEREVLTRWIARADQQRGDAQEVERLNGVLRAIGDFAHDHSSGPTVPDDMWEVRRMAYEAESEVSHIRTAPRPTLSDESDVDEEFTASKYGGTADVVIAMSKESEGLGLDAAGVALPALPPQESLGAEFERVLVENLPQLYSTDGVAASPSDSETDRAAMTSTTEKE